MAASGIDPTSNPQNEVSSGDTTCGFDMTYVKSIHGILKANQIGWSILAFILACIVTGVSPTKVIFIIVTFFGWFLTLIVWFLFATHLYKKVTRFNWFVADLIICASATVLYFATSIPAVISIFSPLMIAAGVFGFVAMGGYAVGVWYGFKRWRESKARQTAEKQYSVEY